MPAVAGTADAAALRFDFYCAARYGDYLTEKSGITKKAVLTRGTIVAVMVTMPSLAAFFAAWDITGDAIYAAIAGAVVHFAAMGFSFAVMKRYFAVKKA